MVYYTPDGSTWRDDGDEAIKGTPALRIHVTNKCSWNICVSRRKKKKAVKNRKFIEVLGYTCCSSRRYISVFQLHPEQDEGIDYKVA